MARKAGDAVKRKERNTPPVPPKCTGDVEARIIALAYSEPPEGRSKWTLWLLPKKSVGLKIMDTIYHMQAGRILKKRIQASLEEYVVHPECPIPLSGILTGVNQKDMGENRTPSHSEAWIIA